MNVGLWTKTKARWLCVVRQLSNCYCNGLHSGDLLLVVLKQVRNFLVDSSCCLLIKLIMSWFYISAWTHSVLMVNADELLSTASLNVLEDIVIFMQLPFCVQFNCSLPWMCTQHFNSSGTKENVSRQVEYPHDELYLSLAAGCLPCLCC